MDNIDHIYQVGLTAHPSSWKYKVHGRNGTPLKHMADLTAILVWGVQTPSKICI